MTKFYVTHSRVGFDTDVYPALSARSAILQCRLVARRHTSGTISIRRGSATGPYVATYCRAVAGIPAGFIGELTVVKAVRMMGALLARPEKLDLATRKGYVTALHKHGPGWRAAA